MNKATDEIKERLSVEEVIGSYIKLEKTGANFKACCPFHNEKTPSFFVSSERQNFYCFGCGKKGDIFNFVEEFEGIDFKEALKMLADKAGVELKTFSFEKKGNEETDLYFVLENATLFFEKNLSKNTQGLEYLKKRGLEEKTIKKFRVGYAEDDWHQLINHLKGAGIKEDDMVRAGLAIRNESGRLYDRFRGRVIFPIFDERGRTVAYSARIMTDAKDQPKYINSPETSLFNKSKILYGFNFAKPTIRKHDFVILVEGQMDVLMAHQIGYTNTVASSGTAFTEDQLQIMKRHTNNLLIAFDGDSAGVASSKKVFELALKNDMDVKVIALKGDSDPADLIQKDVAGWKDSVKNAKHIIEFFAQKILEKGHDKQKQIKEIKIELYPYLINLNSYTEKNYFIEIISEKFGLDKDAIRQDVEGTAYTSEDVSEKGEGNREDKEERVNQKEILYGIYLWQNFTKSPKINVEEYKKVLEQAIPDFIKENSQNIDTEKVIFETEILANNYDNLKSLIDDTLVKIKLEKLSFEKSEIKNRLSKMSGQPDEEKNLIQRFEDISKEVESVKKDGCQGLLKMI